VLPVWAAALWAAAVSGEIPVALEAPGDVGAAVPDAAESPVVVVVAAALALEVPPVAPIPDVADATVLLGAVDGAMEMIRA
jgi:hypothetical protein